MIYAIAAALVLVLDQAVKFWTTKTIPLNAMGDECVQLIPNVLHMTNIHNTGAAFSILRDSRWLLVGVSAVFIILILILISQEIIHTKFGKWTSVLVMAGAVGNCIDRIIYGHVVDMLELEVFSFPVFNVADVFITVCGILFCIHVIFYNDPAAPAKAAALRRERGLPPVEEEPEPAPVRRGRKARNVQHEETDEEAAPRPSRRKAKDDPYSAIPHRERSAHRTLEEEMRPADPGDPFKEWSSGPQEDEFFADDGTASQHRRRADPFLEDEDAYIEQERPLPRRTRRAEPIIEEEPIRRRERKVAPTLADEDDSGLYDRSGTDADASGSARSAPQGDPSASSAEEFSLEDILSEFGNFEDI